MLTARNVRARPTLMRCAHGSARGGAAFLTSLLGKTPRRIGGTSYGFDYEFCGISRIRAQLGGFWSVDRPETLSDGGSGSLMPLPAVVSGSLTRHNIVYYLRSSTNELSNCRSVFASQRIDEILVEFPQRDTR